MKELLKNFLDDVGISVTEEELDSLHERALKETESLENDKDQDKKTKTRTYAPVKEECSTGSKKKVLGKEDVIDKAIKKYGKKTAVSESLTDLLDQIEDLSIGQRRAIVDFYENTTADNKLIVIESVKFNELDLVLDMALNKSYKETLEIVNEDFDEKKGETETLRSYKAFMHPTLHKWMMDVHHRVSKVGPDNIHKTDLKNYNDVKEKADVVAGAHEHASSYLHDMSPRLVTHVKTAFAHIKSFHKPETFIGSDHADKVYKALSLHHYHTSDIDDLIGKARKR